MCSLYQNLIIGTGVWLCAWSGPVRSKGNGHALGNLGRLPTPAPLDPPHHVCRRCERRYGSFVCFFFARRGVFGHVGAAGVALRQRVPVRHGVAGQHWAGSGHKLKCACPLCLRGFGLALPSYDTKLKPKLIFMCIVSHLLFVTALQSCWRCWRGKAPLPSRSCAP